LAITAGPQAITYTSYHQPASLSETIDGTSYLLGACPERSRGADQQRNYSKLRNMTNQSTVEERWYEHGLETQRLNGQASTDRKILYVEGGDGLCAMIVAETGSPQKVYAVYKDHLGSIVAVTRRAFSPELLGGGNSGIPEIIAEQNFDAWGRRRNPVTWFYTSVPNPPAWLYRGYTGHEHVEPFALINMNGRLYDPLNGRMLSADNYVQGGLGTQGYNRYSYAGNNPLKYTDPEGENPLIIAAAIGGLMNWAMNGAQFTWEGLGYFAIGAGAAALGAGVGGGVSSALAGESIVAGLIGTSTVTTTGFAAGALVGGTGGFAGGFTLGFGNSWHGGDPFNTAVGQGLDDGLRSAAYAAAISGVVGGIDAVISRKNFFTGSYKAYPLPDGAVASTGEYPVYSGTPKGATVVNTDDVPTVYMAEDKTAGLDDVIPSGHYIKGKVEGIATRLYGDKVYKVPDFATVVVERGGDVSISNTWPAQAKQVFVPSYDWGWLGRDYFRSVNALPDWEPLFYAARVLQFIKP